MRIRRRGDERRRSGVFNQDRIRDNLEIRNPAYHYKLAFGHKEKGKLSGPARHQTSLHIVLGYKEIKRLS